MTGQAYIQTESGELVPIGVLDTGFSFPTPYDEPTHPTKNFEAEMTFETEYVLTEEKWRDAINQGKKSYYTAWNAPRFKSNVLGNWDWLYTPRDELRDRLNDWLQGKPPAPAINTRFWRGL